MVFARFATILTPQAVPKWVGRVFDFGALEVASEERFKVGGVFEKMVPQGSLMFAMAQVRLKYRPKVTASGHIVPDRKIREGAERALESFANLIAVCHCTSRTISSPNPAVAFAPENDVERALLASAAGIHFEKRNRTIPGALFKIDFDAHLDHLKDRHDGVAILAEGLGHSRASGRFRENIRLFERAFSIGGHDLISPLTTFLIAAPHGGFTQSEVQRWLALRDGVTHADKRNDILFEGDVTWVAQRVMQAAYDVLLNKKSWRAADAVRRDVWTPVCGTLNEDYGLFAAQGAEWNLTIQLLDEFRRFPQNVDANLTSMFPGWWAGPQSAPTSDVG